MRRRQLLLSGWVFPVLVAVITLATFLPSLQNGFVNFDDDKNLVDNRDYRGLGVAQLRWMFTTFHMGHYIPLTWVTLGLDYLLWGMNPLGYHLTSLLLHTGAAIAFYFVARRLLRLGTGPHTDDQGVRVGAAIAALLFAVHPLRVESVAWVTERRDVLSGVFYLAMILAYLRACDPAQHRRRWYWAAVVFSAGALLSKSITVSLPAILLVLDVYPLRRLGGGSGWWGARAWRVYLEKIPFVVLAVGTSAVAFTALVQLRNMASLDQLSVAGRLAVSAYNLGFYLWKTVVPSGLSPLYDLPPEVNPWASPYLLSYGAILAITALAVALRRQVPGLLGAWLAYVLTLLPVSGLFQNGPQVAADRYTYLSSLGWAVLVGGAAVRGWRILGSWRADARLVVPAVALVLILALQPLTVRQISTWRDSLSLWRHALAVKENGIAYHNLGTALFVAGRTAEAIQAFQKAIETVPGAFPRLKARVEFVLGVVLEIDGDLNAAEYWYRQALRLDRDHSRWWNNLGVLLMKRGEIGEALEAFRLALQINPTYGRACANAQRAGELLQVAVPETRECATGPSGEGAGGGARMRQAGSGGTNGPSAS